MMMLRLLVLASMAAITQGGCLQVATPCVIQHSMPWHAAVYLLRLPSHSLHTLLCDLVCPPRWQGDHSLSYSLQLSSDSHTLYAAHAPIRTRSTPRTLQFTHDPHIQRKDVVIGAGHDIGTTSGVASTDACCAACKGKNGCKAWTYHASTKVCWYVPQTRRRSEILTLVRHRCCCRAHTAALTHFIPFSPQVPRLYRRQPTRKGSHLGRPLRPAAPRPAASRTHGCPQRP